MSETIEELIEQGRTLYSGAVNQVLAGFQLIEEMLKSYIANHFDIVRILVKGRLHFEFRREDYQESALGRLTHVFSKLCPNQQLVSDLRAEIKRRDQIAHRALLKSYETGILPDEYSQLLDELTGDMRRIGDLLTRINSEIGKLGSSEGSA